jgi:hydroxyacylglutathione hydrolase
LRAAGLPTMPSSIAIEKATNPFLRYGGTCHRRQPGRRRQARPRRRCSGATFAALREWKNSF